MMFSDGVKHGGIVMFSPDGMHLASSDSHVLTVRDTENLRVVRRYSCKDKIEAVEWSPDSEHLLCGEHCRGLAEVISIKNKKWNCVIDEGSAGMTRCVFSPDGSHVLSFADFNLRLTFWSLANGSSKIATQPKGNLVDFSPDGNYLVVIGRSELKDSVNIISCNGWELVDRFEPETSDASMVKWSPDGSAICVVDTPLNYSVLIYSPNGSLLGKYVAYEGGLGVKSIAWSPTGQLLAVGSYDQRARLLNNLTWKSLTSFAHSSTLKEDEVIVFREAREGGQTKYLLEDGIQSIPRIRPSADKPNPKLGVGNLAWSADSRFLFTQNNNMPNVLWIWDIARMSLQCVIIQLERITCATWTHRGSKLAIGCGTNSLYMWTEEGCSCLDIPISGFSLYNVEWSRDDNVLLLSDRGRFSCCFFQNEE